MLYTTKVAVFSEIYTKHKNTPCGQNVSFLGAFANLQKAVNNIVIYVCLSVCPHRTTQLPSKAFSGKLKFD